MRQKVTFSIGRFGPFDGALTSPKDDQSKTYQLSFGPIYVNARALSAEKYIQIQKKKHIILEGIYSGTITVDQDSHATYGDLTIEP